MRPDQRKYPLLRLLVFQCIYRGKLGYFDRALLVYGRGGQECVRCGAEIVKITVGGRGTHYCPVCQKVPRYR